jgi:hypothetical protein
MSSVAEMIFPSLRPTVLFDNLPLFTYFRLAKRLANLCG